MHAWCVHTSWSLPSFSLASLKPIATLWAFAWTSSSRSSLKHKENVSSSANPTRRLAVFPSRCKTYTAGYPLTSRRKSAVIRNCSKSSLISCISLRFRTSRTRATCSSFISLVRSSSRQTPQSTAARSVAWSCRLKASFDSLSNLGHFQWTRLRSTRSSTDQVARRK